MWRATLDARLRFLLWCAILSHAAEGGKKKKKVGCWFSTRTVMDEWPKHSQACACKCCICCLRVSALNQNCNEDGTEVFVRRDFSNWRVLGVRVKWVLVWLLLYKVRMVTLPKSCLLMTRLRIEIDGWVFCLFVCFYAWMVYFTPPQYDVLT